ncbi:MAG: NAD(P)-binding protein [Deltaproteobacteria bacterium]|nr:NAD(P)-binding protein [Deltaproteobacteria bacterium]
MLERPERILERYPLVQDPPFTLNGTKALMFLLPADPLALDALLARSFEWARPSVELHRLGHHVLMTLTDTAEATAGDPSLGSFAYSEASFFVPVWGMRGGAPFLAMHVPFIYPNEGLAVAAGREIYGLPKKPASVSVPDADAFWNGTDVAEVEVLGAEIFDGSPWRRQPLMTVQALTQSAMARLADELLDDLDALIGPFPGSLGSLGHLLEQDLIQLKQIADVTPGGVPPRALYRAVTRVAAPVQAVRNVRVGDASKVSINLAQMASEPIREVLGLPASVTPSFAASLEMDFRFEPGEVLEELPEDGRVPPEKTKVLIAGGGMGALATAYYLTDTEARRDKYDVRILAMGNILGGKGANWRNASRAERIEEHGIHVIFGFYHNFLRMFREVYAEANRPETLDPSTFDEAFSPRWDVVFNDGENSFEVKFPRTPDTFGAGPTSVSDMLDMLKSLIADHAGHQILDMLEGVIFPSLGNPVAAEMFAFTLTLIKGIAEDHILRGKSWDELDALDFRDWMESHRIPGMPEIRDSAIMQVPYDGVFAYKGPDQSDPKLSAGVAARGLLKLVTDYEKAVFYDMEVGMGEAVFAPLYEVLKARGVKVEFFAKVKTVELSAGRVEKVTYGRQAVVTAGPYEYDPFRQVGTVRVWRRDPDLTQLTPPVPIAGLDPFADDVNAQVGADIELNVGSDFDWVVCALPAPVTARVLRGHLADPTLANIQHIPTVATFNLETWLNDTLPLLGWPWGSVVVGGFRQPLNSLQENGRLLNVEAWSGPGAPKALIYASGPFGAGWSTDSFDPASRALAEAAVQTEARKWVRDEYWRVLPAAETGTPPVFDESVLHHPWTPGDPMADQYVHESIDQWSRYLLMEPGTLKFRPTPTPLTLSNLRLAGDWTKNGFDIPSMEGTVTSALLAAQSILDEDLNILR